MSTTRPLPARRLLTLGTLLLGTLSLDGVARAAPGASPTEGATPSPMAAVVRGPGGQPVVAIRLTPLQELEVRRSAQEDMDAVVVMPLRPQQLAALGELFPDQRASLPAIELRVEPRKLASAQGGSGLYHMIAASEFAARLQGASTSGGRAANPPRSSASPEESDASDEPAPTAQQREVRAVVAELSGRPAGELSRGASLAEDLGLDSLSVVELVMVVEERLGVKISDQELAEVSTVGELEDLVEGKRDG